MWKVGDDMGKERQQYLSRPDVQAYLQKYPDITKEEKRDLLKWLKSGNSPATNDCDLCDDRGYPLDFIDGRRTIQDLFFQHMHNLNEPEKTDVNSDVDSFELPF